MICCFFGAHGVVMELSVHLPKRRMYAARLAQALLLSAAAFAATCAAQPGAEVAADGVKQPADFKAVLRAVTYFLISVSTVQLVISALTILRMPQPRCLCYTVPYSDVATCFGTPCCQCANIRQLSASMILVWSVLLMCQLSTGMDHMFLYPYLGFCALHALTFGVVHVLIRGYQRDEALLAAAAAANGTNHAAMRLAVAAGGRSGRSGAAVGASPQRLPPIQTMSAELVLVIQPDYGCYEEAGTGREGGLGRCSSSSVVTGGARGGGGGGGGGGSEKGYAWAIRYTRTAETVAPASPVKLKPVPSLGYGGAEGALPLAPASAENRAHAASGGFSVGGAGGQAPSADASALGTFGGEVATAAATATSTAAALWRTGSGSVWPSAMPFAGPPTATAVCAGAGALAATGGGGRQAAFCARSASVGFPLHQASSGVASNGGGAPSPCSSPSYRLSLATLSKRSSPVPPPHHQSPSYYDSPQPPPASPRGGSPRSSGSSQPHYYAHQLQQRPPRPPSSCSSSVCGGSPPPPLSRMGLPRTELSLPTVPASPRPVPSPGALLAAGTATAAGPAATTTTTTAAGGTGGAVSAATVASAGPATSAGAAAAAATSADPAAAANVAAAGAGPDAEPLPDRHLL